MGGSVIDNMPGLVRPDPPFQRAPSYGHVPAPGDFRVPTSPQEHGPHQHCDAHGLLTSHRLACLPSSLLRGKEGHSWVPAFDCQARHVHASQRQVHAPLLTGRRPLCPKIGVQPGRHGKTTQRVITLQIQPSTLILLTWSPWSSKQRHKHSMLSFVLCDFFFFLFPQKS